MNVPSKSETEQFANGAKEFVKAKKQSSSSLFPNVRFQN